MRGLRQLQGATISFSYQFETCNREWTGPWALGAPPWLKTTATQLRKPFPSPRMDPSASLNFTINALTWYQCIGTIMTGSAPSGAEASGIALDSHGLDDSHAWFDALEDLPALLSDLADPVDGGLGLDYEQVPALGWIAMQSCWHDSVLPLTNVAPHVSHPCQLEFGWVGDLEVLDVLRNPRLILARDKAAFVLGNLMVWTIAYWLGWQPATFHKLYTAETLVLGLARWVFFRCVCVFGGGCPGPEWGPRMVYGRHAVSAAASPRVPC